MSIYNSYFFHNLTEKYINIVGSLLNEIEIKSSNRSKKTIMSIVPLIYSNKEKYVQRLLNDTDQTSKNAFNNKLPMIAYSLTDIAFQSDRNLPRQHSILTVSKDGGKGINRTFTPVPYQLTFTVEIISKTQNELFQILEQIIPAFKPDVTIKVKVIDGGSFDVPITLGGIFINDNYDGDISSRRIISATLTLNMYCYYFSPVNKPNIILNISLDNYQDGGDIDKNIKHISTHNIDIYDNKPNNLNEIVKSKFGDNLTDEDITELLKQYERK